MPEPEHHDATAGGPPHWYYDARWLLVLILFVLGPLAIPLVWKSRQISRRTQVVLTAIAVAYALLTLGAIVRMVRTTLDILGDPAFDLSGR